MPFVTWILDLYGDFFLRWTVIKLGFIFLGNAIDVAGIVVGVTGVIEVESLYYIIKYKRLIYINKLKIIIKIFYHWYIYYCNLLKTFWN